MNFEFWLLKELEKLNAASIVPPKMGEVAAGEVVIGTITEARVRQLVVLVSMLKSAIAAIDARLEGQPCKKRGAYPGHAPLTCGRCDAMHDMRRLEERLYIVQLILHHDIKVGLSPAAQQQYATLGALGVRDGWKVVAYQLPQPAEPSVVASPVVLTELVANPGSR